MARSIDGYVATGREGRRSADRDAGKHPATHRMVEKPATPTGRERYAQRKRLSEAPNGRIGEIPGFRRFGGAGQGAGGMGPSLSGAEHQTVATASGSMSAPGSADGMGPKSPASAGLPDLPNPSVSPAGHCALPVFRPSSPSPHRVRPVRPFTFLS